MATPFWFLLVRTWCLNGRTGLTLPFLVGADARARNTPAALGDVRRLLDKIRKFRSADGSLVLRWCPNRGAPVVGVEPFGDRQLRVDDTLKAKWGTNEEKIFEELAQVSEMRVKDGGFSRVGDPPEAQWVAFDRDDLEFIDSVIGRQK
jgi:hypothetical protein